MINENDYKKLLKIMEKIALSKNNDYAGKEDFLANFRSSERLGIKPSIGVAVRISDKWSRICQLLQKDNPEVEDEKIEDTLIDMANYCLLMILCLRDESKQLNNMNLID